MAETPLDLTIPPGIIKNRSPHAAGSRYTDGDKIRFSSGKAEKIGGWSKLVDAQFESFARGAEAFTDQYGNQHVSFGTSDRLYVVDAGERLINVTPAIRTGSLTNPFSTTNASDIVSVAHSTHGLNAVGDVVTFANATAVGGITIDGEYTVYNIVDADTFEIQHSAAATSTAGPGGGTVDYEHEIPKGPVDGALNTGYGVGGYGEGTYGTPRTDAGIELEPRIWSVENYGSNFLACYNTSTLYELAYGSTARAQAVANAPDMRAMFITPERYIMALGATPNGGSAIDPMTVRWPDVNDNTAWTPTSTNTANERRLQYGAKLMGGAGLSDFISLVWSDQGLYVFQYTGSDFVYESRLKGRNCGLIGRHSYAVADGRAYWMSAHGFHLFDGAVRPVPREDEIRDFVIDNINQLQSKKAACGFISQFREVWWIYPTTSDEPDRYVGVNIDTFDWIVGSIARTTICRYRTDQASPLMFGADRYVYLHEDGTKDDDGSAMSAFLQTGLMKVGNGRQFLDIHGFIPDFEEQTGDVSLYVVTREPPKGDVYDSQTVVITDTEDLVDLRVSGRLMEYRLTSESVGGNFRVGINQIEVASGGRRRGG